MALETKAGVEIDVRGADKAAAAARSALNPWSQQVDFVKGKFKELRGEVAGALGAIASDFKGVVMAGNQVNFTAAVAGANAFEKATAQLAVASNRDIKAIQNNFDELGRKIGEKPQEIAAYVSSVGKQMYNFDEAEKNLSTFANFAKETGRSLSEVGGVQAGFKRMGIDDADKALRQLRANADSLKTIGGVGALTDQVVGLSGVFNRASTDASKLIGITAALGKGLRPDQAGEVQQAVMGTFADSQRMYETHFRATGALKRGETLIDRKTGKFDIQKAMRLRQAELKRMSPETAFSIASGEFGSTIAAAQFLAMDFGAIGGLTGQEAASDAQDKYNKSDAGQRGIREATKEIETRKHVDSESWLGRARNAIGDFTAENPLTSAIGGGLTGVLAKVAGGWIKGKIAGEAVKQGGKVAAQSIGVEGLGAAAGPLAIMGIGLGQMQAMANLKVSPEEFRKSAGVAEGFTLTGSGVGTQRMGIIRSAQRAADRTAGMGQGAFLKELGPSALAQAENDPVLQGAIRGISGGQFQGMTAEAIATAVVSALAKNPPKIEIHDNTTLGVDVSNQLGGQQ